MKKTSYILFAALSLLFASCAQESLTPASEEDGVIYIKTPPQEGDMVEVSFTAVFPDLEATTKGEMGETPAIDNLYAAVFGGNHGQLQNWIPCKYTTAPTENGYGARVTYTVQLPITDLHRTIHFIANPPTTDPEFKYEPYVMDTLMYTEGTKAAYWQMKDFPNGIKVATDSEGDYAFTNGAYVASQELKDSLEIVALVRNFAKITVKSADKNFKVLNWELINYPTAGSVAPYNEYSETFKTPYYWIDKYRDDDSYTSVEQIGDSSDEGASTIENKYETGHLFHDLLAYEYGGFVPPAAKFNTSKPETLTKKDGEYAFMYERGLPLASQTAVIVHIQWLKDDGTVDDEKTLEGYNANEYSYYKIEVLDSEGEYVPIYRNLTYTLALSDIQGLGKKSVELAYKGAYFGNVSSSLQTSLVNEITDNKSTLYVGNMDVSLRDSTTFDILYWFRPDNKKDTYLYKDDLKKQEACSYIHYEVEDVDGYEPAIASDVPITVTGTTVDSHNAGILKFTTYSPDDVKIRKSYLRISGQYFDKGTANVTSYRELYRKVTVTVLPKLNFSNCSITESVKAEAGQEVTIKFSIPKDLGESVFPLNIFIEAQDPCLTTNDTSLPVNTGKSAFDSSMMNYYFVKTINYVDYCKITAKGYEYTTDYTCTLKTTVDVVSTTIRLSDKGGYFNYTDLDLVVNE